MSAQRYLSGAEFFHGSRAKLSVGDILEPGKYAARNTPEAEHDSDVFMTHRPDEAQFFADSAKRSEHGYLPTVYRVEPLGEVKPGKMHDWTLGGEYVTPKAKITGIEEHTYRWPGEPDKELQVHYERDALRAAGTPAEADRELGL